jgi:energy-coupling factor transporter ATP-binding protein EcfA2
MVDLQLPEYAPEKFVNRYEEIKLITQKVGALAEGRPVERRTVVFIGERGAGKSWLLDHLQAILPRQFRDLKVLRLDLKAYVDEDPTWAVADMIQRVSIETSGPGERLGPDLATMSRRLMEHLRGVLQKSILLLLMDHVHESDWNLLPLLEDYLLGPLAAESRVLIVMTGRGRLYPWKTPELRLKAEFIDLLPFQHPEETRAQLERQVPRRALSQVEEIHRLSQGNPLANYLLGTLGVLEGLDRVVEEILEPVPADRRRQVREYLEALCVLNAFDEERIPEMLAAYYGDDSYRQWTYAQARQVREELIRWAFARWNADAGGYILDPVARRLVEEYLKKAQPEKWQALQRAAQDMYTRWARDFARTRERWQKEAVYHHRSLQLASM